MGLLAQIRSTCKVWHSSGTGVLRKQRVRTGLSLLPFLVCWNIWNMLIPTVLVRISVRFAGGKCKLIALGLGSHINLIDHSCGPSRETWPLARQHFVMVSTKIAVLGGWLTDSLFLHLAFVVYNKRS